MIRSGSPAGLTALVMLVGLWSTCAVAQDTGDGGGTSTYDGRDDRDAWDGRDSPIDWNDVPDDRDRPDDDRGVDRQEDRGGDQPYHDHPPAPPRIRDPRISDVLADQAAAYAVKLWSDYEQAAHESLVNHKDGSSAYAGYDPGMTKDGFKTFRTRGTAITVGYIIGERLGVWSVNYVVGQSRLGKVGGWKGFVIGQAVDLVAGEIGDRTGGGMAVIVSLFVNSDVINYNVGRAAEIFSDPWTYEPPLSGWPSRPNW